MFRKLIEYVNDFFIWDKERKQEEFHIVERITDFVINYDKSTFTNLDEDAKSMDLLYQEYKEEEKKEYSERKYEIMDKINISINIFMKKRQKALEDMVVSYYIQYNEELIEDLDKTIEWVKYSEWFRERRENLISVRKIFIDSNIEREINYYKNAHI